MDTNKRQNTRQVIPLILVIGLGILALTVICLGVLYLTSPAGANNNTLSAKLSEIAGVVEVKNNVQDSFNPVNDGFLLKSAMQLQTMQESKVRLDVSTGSIVRLGPSTIFSLDTQQNGSQGVLAKIQLQAGRVFIILQGGSLDVNTPAGLASVRGSYMSVWVEPKTNRITVCCLEGKCGYQNKAGDVDMTSGQKIVSANTNNLPGIEKMDHTDIQSWLDNSPEAVVMVTQIANLVSTSTPTETVTYTATDTSTATETPTATSTFTATPTASLTATSTPRPTIIYQPTWTVPPVYTKTPKPKHTRTPTPYLQIPIRRITLLPIFIPTSTPTQGEIIN
ncbi:MAG TPA: FecR domain-containing protein [Anaerolineaceae bacterium]|nr:FecR domain-containing protein [Anaerolineaceae bacterium]